MKTVSGYVENITFRNEDNGFTVLTLSSGKEDITCTGNFGYIGQGEYVEIEGEEVFHEIYGKQIKATNYKIVPATDELSLKKYLGSGAIKGLGAVLADRIVDKFGEDTFRIIEEEPERLAEIRGITTRKAMDISTQLEEKKDMRDVMIFLQGYGISPTLSTKIFNNYGTRVYDIIKTNPYQLADDVTGIGFKTADEIARRAGVEVNASVRIKSGMCYALTEASLSGHTYLPKEKMVETTINLLGLRDQYLNADGTYNMELLDNCFTELVLEKKLILKEIDKRFLEELKDKGYAGAEIQEFRIINNNTVRMANLAIHVGHTVNGVAQLHTDILKKTELNNWYKLYPEKFQNKTNGITPRRWLRLCNKELSKLITELLGNEDWVRELSLLKNLEKINLEDEIFRSLAILSSARVITNSELMQCLSNVKLGIEMGYIEDVSLEKITKLMTGRQPYLKIISAYDEENKIERATYIRREFSLANRNNK